MSGAYLFLVIFLLPVPAAASVPDENGTFSEEMENSLDNESFVNNSSGDDFSDHNFNSTDNRKPGSDSSSGSDSQSPDSDNSSSDLDGFFSGDDTSSSSKDKTIHVIIENGNSSNDLNGNGLRHNRSRCRQRNYIRRRIYRRRLWRIHGRQFRQLILR